MALRPRGTPKKPKIVPLGHWGNIWVYIWGTELQNGLKGPTTTTDVNVSCFIGRGVVYTSLGEVYICHALLGKMCMFHALLGELYALDALLGMVCILHSLDGRELSVLCLLERAYMMHALLWQKYVVHIHYQRLQIVIDSSEWCNLMEWRLPVLHKGKVQNASSHAAVAWWCMYIVLLELFDLNVTLYYWMWWWYFIDWYVTIYYWLKCDDVCIVLLELIYWNVTMYV